MKSNIFLIFLIVLGFSCSDDSNTEPPLSASDSFAYVNNSTKMEEAISTSTDLYLIQIGIMLRGGPTASENINLDLPECTTMTQSITNEGLYVTLNFGEGCEDQFGNIHAGIIHILISTQPNNITYTKTFENYTFNGNTVIGTITGVRTVENNIVRVNRNAVLTITTTEGFVINRTAQHIISLISGGETLTEHDNVFSITGGSTNVLNNNATWIVTIQEPLILPATCHYKPVSGTLTLVNGNASIFVEYGNGDCDGTAHATLPNGEVISFNL